MKLTVLSLVAASLVLPAVLTIPACDSDLAVVNIRVRPDGGAMVTIARVRDASDASEIDHPIIRGTGTVKTTNVTMQINRAQAKDINRLDLGGITFNLSESPSGRSLEVSLPSSKKNSWYMLLPKLDAALDVQSLRVDPFFRRTPSDPPLSESRLDEIAAESRRLRLSIEVVVPWEIKASKLDRRGTTQGWRTTVSEKNKAVLLIPLDYPEGADSGIIVWRVDG